MRTLCLPLFTGLLLSVLLGCSTTTERVYTRPTGKTQALLLTQPFAFDAAAKDRIDGPYRSVRKVTVPGDLSPQNKWFMFEGPVLENDRIAFRYYADRRHRFDIFGKTTEDLVMDTVSWQYHEVMDWGSDILKVGESLGSGSPALYHRGRVVPLTDWEEKKISVLESGGDRSAIRTEFAGLRVGEHTIDLVQDWTIGAGDQYVTVDLYVPGGALPAGVEFATGVVAHLPEAVTGQHGGQTYVMTYGDQSYHGHGLGMAVVADNKFGPQAGKDDLSHLLVFDKARERVRYRVVAAWDRDGSGVGSAADFSDLLFASIDQ